MPAKGSNTRTWIDNNFEKNNISLEPQYEFSSGKALVSFVKQSETIGYANVDIVKSVMGDDAIILEDDFEVNRKELGIAYLDEKIASPTVKKFLEYLKN